MSLQNRSAPGPFLLSFCAKKTETQRQTELLPRVTWLPRWLSREDSPYQCRRWWRLGFDPWLGKIPGERNGNPLQYSCWDNPMDREAWQATVHGATESDTAEQRCPRVTWLKMKVKVTQSGLTLCDSIHYTVHGILQARILEWVAVSFSRGSSQPRNRTGVSRLAGGFLTSWAIRVTWLLAWSQMQSPGAGALVQV